MIIVFLGDDIETSRNEFLKLRLSYQKLGWEIFELNENNFTQIKKWLANSQFLFSEKKVFFGENLLKNLSLVKILEDYQKRKDMEFIFWEEFADKKKIKEKLPFVIIKEFKLSANIFNFLDAIFPGNLKKAVYFLNQVSQTTNENLILYLLQKRVRDLILVKENITNGVSFYSWQLSRIKNQARLWEKEKLINFYQALFRIELFQKTGRNIYSIKKSLDILLCYFL